MDENVPLVPGSRSNNNKLDIRYKSVPVYSRSNAEKNVKRRNRGKAATVKGVTKVKGTRLLHLNVWLAEG
jgi:hypothetical protein